MIKKIHLLAMIVISTTLPLTACTAETGETAVPAESAHEQAPPMNNQRLFEMLRRIDKNVEGSDGYWQLSVAGYTVSVITDTQADRMRIVTPVASTDGLDATQLHRLMQANFDSALDARYAIANNILWSAFIHPLSSLQAKDFLQGIGEVVNLAITYGGSYSSGVLIFNGGDSGEIQRRELIDELVKKGMAV